MITAEKFAKRHAERCCERPQFSLVDGLAGFEPLNRARQNTRFPGELVNAVPACDATADDARR